MIFMEWWFDSHYIMSTIFTPGFTFGWAVYKGLVIRGIVAIFIWGVIASK